MPKVIDEFILVSHLLGSITGIRCSNQSEQTGCFSTNQEQGMYNSAHSVFPRFFYLVQVPCFSFLVVCFYNRHKKIAVRQFCHQQLSKIAIGTLADQISSSTLLF